MAIFVFIARILFSLLSSLDSYRLGNGYLIMFQTETALQEELFSNVLKKTLLRVSVSECFVRAEYESAICFVLKLRENSISLSVLFLFFLFFAIPNFSVSRREPLRVTAIYPPNILTCLEWRCRDGGYWSESELSDFGMSSGPPLWRRFGWGVARDRHTSRTEGALCAGCSALGRTDFRRRREEVDKARRACPLRKACLRAISALSRPYQKPRRRVWRRRASTNPPSISDLAIEPHFKNSPCTRGQSLNLLSTTLHASCNKRYKYSALNWINLKNRCNKKCYSCFWLYSWATMKTSATLRNK